MGLIVVGLADCQVGECPPGTGAGHVCPRFLHRSEAVYDPQASVGGLLHFMLPDSAIDPVPQGARIRFMFADTGIPLLLDRVCQKGSFPAPA